MALNMATRKVEKAESDCDKVKQHADLDKKEFEIRLKKMEDLNM
jgi:hypothetical protein